MIVWFIVSTYKYFKPSCILSLLYYKIRYDKYKNYSAHKKTNVVRKIALIWHGRWIWNSNLCSSNIPAKSEICNSKKHSGQLIINIYHTHSIIFKDQIIIPYLKQYQDIILMFYSKNPFGSNVLLVDIINYPCTVKTRK